MLWMVLETTAQRVNADQLAKKFGVSVKAMSVRLS
jgi:hypothetical protein